MITYRIMYRIEPSYKDAFDTTSTAIDWTILREFDNRWEAHREYASLRAGNALDWEYCLEEYDDGITNHRPTGVSED